jgi:hypothetical protein
MQIRLSLLFLLLTIYPSEFLSAQTDSLGVDSSYTESEDERNKPLGDTTSVYRYSFSDNSPKLIDSTLNDFENPNPGWRERMPYQSDLGHLGTAVFSLLWQSSPKAGFRTGMDIFSYLRLKPEDIPIYKIGGNKPFTDLYYSQINLQNVQLRANFAHQILPSLYYGIHYSIINYNGYFKGQRSRHQDVALNFRYFKKRYEANFGFVNNVNNQSENGGVVVQSLSLTDPLFLINQDVQLNAQNNGSPKHENAHQTVNLRHYLYNEVNAAKSAFGHHFRFENNSFKFFDKNPAIDSSYYGAFQTNNRGIRHYLRHRLIENELNWQRALFGTLKNSPLLIKVALVHSFHQVFQQPSEFNVNNFALSLNLSENTENNLNYTADLKIMNSRLGVDFWLQGALSYAIKDYFRVGGKLLYQQYEPEQTARQFYLSGVNIWNNTNSLKQTQELSLNAYIAWPKFWGKFEINNHTISRSVYFDTTAQLSQMQGSANIVQLMLRQDLHIWKFHLENEAIWQTVLSGKEVFRLPELILRHKFYFESKVLKTVKLRTGIAFRYMTSFYTNAYFPVLGAFYLQNEQLMNFYPQADIFVSAKIWQLRFFVNAENLTYYLNGWQNYYNAPYYPTPNWFVRFGVSWQLFD